jgi:hypothetical protein
MRRIEFALHLLVANRTEHVRAGRNDKRKVMTARALDTFVRTSDEPHVAMRNSWSPN